MVMLTAEQAKSLIGAAAGDRLEALLVLALATGARQGELLGLTWDRVENKKAEEWDPTETDQTPAYIRITKTLQAEPGGEFTLEEPKTASSVRRVELPRQAVEALKRHRKLQAAEQLEAKVWLNERDLVFVSEVGSPIHKTNLTRRAFRPWLKKAGLPAMRWHDLRHVAASLMLGQKGVPVTVVAEMLGHADVGITLSTYAHVIPGQQSLAREAMEELLA
jgi:integrase